MPAFVLYVQAAAIPAHLLALAGIQAPRATGYGLRATDHGRRTADADVRFPMVIKASSAGEIRALVEALSGRDEVRREAAIARLAVIGARAVPHILTAFESAPDRAARLALMRALDPLADPRAAGPAREALTEGGDLAIAAVQVLKGLIDARLASVASAALDALMATALDPRAERRVRLAAIEVLAPIADVQAGLAGALAGDPDPGIRARAGHPGEPPAGEDAVWRDALDGHLPDDPRVLRDALSQHGSRAALGELRKLVDVIRAREEASDEGARAGWRAVRGAAHQALALRGSRVALYDLRETIEGASAELPPSFLAAVQLVGDGSCLEALAAAFERAESSDQRWRAQLGAAFRAVALRERVTRRHALMKRILARWPDAGQM